MLPVHVWVAPSHRSPPVQQRASAPMSLTLMLIRASAIHAAMLSSSPPVCTACSAARRTSPGAQRSTGVMTRGSACGALRASPLNTSASPDRSNNAVVPFPPPCCLVSFAIHTRYTTHQQKDRRAAKGEADEGGVHSELTLCIISVTRERITSLVVVHQCHVSAQRSACQRQRQRGCSLGKSSGDRAAAATGVVPPLRPVIRRAQRCPARAAQQRNCGAAVSIRWALRFVHPSPIWRPCQTLSRCGPQAAAQRAPETVVGCGRRLQHGGQAQSGPGELRAGSVVNGAALTSTSTRLFVTAQRAADVEGARVVLQLVHHAERQSSRSG